MNLRVAHPAGAWLAALGALLLCCGRAASPDGVTPREPAEVGVSVESHYAGLVVIYVHTGGTSHRLGQVSFQEVKGFTIPWRRLGGDGSFFLRAEVIGSDVKALTDDLRVQPGQVVRWTLTPNLDMSSVSVY